jgi:hypothetical protein
MRREGETWWPEETITDEDVAACLRGWGSDHPDILVSHDVPTDGQEAMARTEYWKDEPDTTANRAKLQQIVDELHPKMVIHGHYHVRYKEVIDARTTINDIHPAYLIYGFGMDGEFESI